MREARAEGNSDQHYIFTNSPHPLPSRLDISKGEDMNIKALAMINPGNPTGQVLSYEAVREICGFCADNNIVLLSDEVYQRNVYSEDR